MAKNLDVAVLVGSLRKGSFSRKIALALEERAPRSVTAHIVEIGDLPLYNEDLEEQVPAAWSRFRREVEGASGLLWVTPEYNRSIPGCLKNALDVASRPEKKNLLNGVPSGIVSVTPYKLGGLAANEALRQALVFPNSPVMQQPEAYIGGAADLLDDAGALKDTKTSDFLKSFMASFARWVETIRGASGESGTHEGGDFTPFMKERERAAAAYVSGDGAPLHALATRKDPATFFNPGGDVVRGADSVAQRYEKDVHAFEAGGNTRLEVLQSGAGGELAFWTGYQVAEARLRGKKEAVPMKLRITEVFRREDATWKLVHRHADMPREPDRR